MDSRFLIYINGGCPILCVIVTGRNDAVKVIIFTALWIDPRFFRVCRVEHDALVQCNAAAPAKAEGIAEARSRRAFGQFGFVGICLDGSEQEARRYNKYGQDKRYGPASHRFPRIHENSRHVGDCSSATAFTTIHFKLSPSNEP